jgi:hypothetical protein
MARKWTPADRRAQRERVSKYWERVRLISQVEKIPLSKARDFYSRGLFRGVREDVSKRVADRYEARRDSKGRLYVIRTTPSGKQIRVKPESVERSLASSTYEALVRRLVVHTGFKRADVRAYLAQYPNYRDGISPLFRMIEPIDDGDDETEDF